MTRRFSGYEPHECPDYAPCPVCRSIPLDMLGKQSILSPEFVLELMIEDGLIALTECLPDPLKHLEPRKAA